MSEREKVEGTLILDGLVEGSPPSLGDVESDLRSWAQKVERLGFPLSLAIEGNSFSVLAEPRPILIDELPPSAASPSDAISAALDSLLEIFPEDERRTLLSTIRSTEFRPATEVQTIYAVGPDGTIHTQQRLQDAETVPPPEQLSRREIIKMSIIGGAVALVLLALTGLIIHAISPEFWPGLFDRVKQLDPQEVVLEAGALDPYITLADAKVKGGRLYVKVQRRPAYPLTGEQRDALYAAARTAEDYRTRFAAEAVLRGYVTVEMFSAKGEFLGTTQVRIAGLADAESITISLPLPKQARPARIVFGG